MSLFKRNSAPKAQKERKPSKSVFSRQRKGVAHIDAPTDVARVANNAYRPARRLIQVLAFAAVVVAVVLFAWVRPKASLIDSELDEQATAQFVFTVKTQEALVARAADANQALDEARRLDALLPMEVDTLDVMDSIEQVLLRTGHDPEVFTAEPGAADREGPEALVYSEINVSIKTTENNLGAVLSMWEANEPLVTVRQVVVDFDPESTEINVIARLGVWSMPSVLTVPAAS